ncbi:acetyltransferase [Porphyromonas macacae]|uniref:Acetyltransferase n=2 Tax=Porphyromonas macacae TaxID=28115 RepID=A0A0A2GBN4_9PORP|nr:lysophospholipid acyltransferase family protein [Porphyromonas macacae]KGN74897.1 acetyltransferase [Porphyromonas macacae]KGN99822.1 acetyltransferase [Porphyromonas macacae]
MVSKLFYKTLYSFGYLFSLIPLRVLYLFSDLLYFPLYYCIRYRRKIVRKNLVASFPEKTLRDIIRIEKKFYAFFCDYIIETIKLFSISRKAMMRRMKFENIQEIEEVFASGQSCSLYLGHYCNWEWISSLPMHIGKECKCGQIYHALENPAFDRLFLKIRGRFGAHSIAMEDTFRTIVTWQRQGDLSIVGYISDQAPSYNAMHYWTNFLNHEDTPVFTGPERISRLVNAVPFYTEIERTKRGYYKCRFIRMTESIKETPKFSITETYFRMLENTIVREPSFWLWSHNRWKRTREGFQARFSEEEQQKLTSRL